MGRLTIFSAAALICCATTSCHSTRVKQPGAYNDALVVTIDEKLSGTKEAERLGQYFPASDFEPVGLYLQPWKSVTVTVKNVTGDSQPQLLVGTYSRYKAEDEPTVYDLDPGTNKITSLKGGLMYLRYVTDDAPAGTVEVTFTGGRVVPVYRLGETTHEQWLQTLETSGDSDVQFIGNRTMVVVSKDVALQFKDVDQDEMLKTLDRLSDIEDAISGLDGSSPLHQPNVHKLLITETADEEYFLAANEYRVMVVGSACNKFMDPKEAGKRSWGVWHEMGHMRQMVNWDWERVDEVTVNIYSLAVLRAMQAEVVWLKGNACWNDVAEYLALPLEERDYNASPLLRGKGRLAMFQQLYLAYGEDFYPTVHRLTREEKADCPETEEKMAYFMLVSSKASGFNLKDFFIQWGFKLPQKDFDALDALNLPSPTIDLVKLQE